MTEEFGFSYSQKSKLDSKDWEILEVLSQDGRLSVAAIARKTGLKREVVKYRLNRMVREKIILRFLTMLNLPKVGYNLWGYVHIRFKDMTPKREKEFLEHVRNNANIIFAHTTLGAWDFGIEFFAKDPGHFYSLQKELKEKFSDIIKDFETGSFIDIVKINYVPIPSDVK
ncbi:Lrp/AsnC family transcriptional regulator [Candidatus Micrarchaeota archaeon]|nr:Lrp/AsnC family transcriptional regulator [Candidatus Micrarchaeota archaeon]